MISFFKDKINIHSDNLQSAIVKKTNNKSLSGKSLEKLVSVANTQYKFKNGEADFILRDTPCITGANYEKVSRLIKDIKNIKPVKNDSFIQSKISSWEANAKELLKNNCEPKIEKQLLGKGSRGTVYKDGEFILKKTKNSTLNEVFHEANMCNEYNIKEGGFQNTATIVDNCIKMPFINGEVPDTQDTLIGVNNLFKNGFLMGDAKPSNFLKTPDGSVQPVDFGLVFKRNELESIDVEVKKNIVSDYIKGGFRYIPGEIKKEYHSCIEKLDYILGKDSPMRKINTKALSKAGF
ncbi:hypothetical protein C3432_23690 [Citrobacter amalonaticus]|uniref:Protein kinase domain-containing protein n=1 Tax=Citrobacter amalonaticus TaxID=35703 RepID=A0A2S4S115_CITAM|nr:hypothetical protein [Citrobacter amalonaticus]POT55290.1 hypothetical protein C3432_23690 [Citrobacter amalonaticus]POT77102.1 hypothetical protein C3436_06605 [Citrobacter amalonaticus]POU67554.1 hypothetical protein C3430_00140 [Citrobacter amalonaticus]POV07159.1 hypothetical protein C3424_00150 [Citrobacter amalonaticus]